MSPTCAAYRFLGVPAPEAPRALGFARCAAAAAVFTASAFLLPPPPRRHVRPLRPLLRCCAAAVHRQRLELLIHHQLDRTVRHLRSVPLLII